MENCFTLVTTEMLRLCSDYFFAVVTVLQGKCGLQFEEMTSERREGRLVLHFFLASFSFLKSCLSVARDGVLLKSFNSRCIKNNIYFINSIEVLNI
jgi:hypothetical protein